MQTGRGFAGVILAVAAGSVAAAWACGVLLQEMRGTIAGFRQGIRLGAMRVATAGAQAGDTLRGAPLFDKIMAIVLAMAMLLGATTAWIFHVSWGQHERTEVQERGLRLATHLAALIDPLVRTGRIDDARRLVEELDDVEPEANCVRVTDGEGRVLASTLPIEPDAPTHAVAAFAPNSAVRVTVDVSEAEIARETIKFTGRMAVMVALITLGGVCAIWCVVRLVTRPIQSLVESVRAVKAGNYGPQVPVRAHDEVGELTAAFNEMGAALEERRAACRYLLRKVIAAAEDERKRVSRELHDHTGQALTSLIAGLAAMENGADAKRAAELRAQAVQTLAEVHDLTLTLRPKALDDLGLVPALRKFCRGASQRFGVSVDCEAIGLDEDVRLPGEIEVALYRIGQEALTNAVHHGGARSVEVLVQRKAASVLAIVQDDGQGFDAGDWANRCRREDHLGLLGIEERAALLGGTLRVESRPGAGTSLFVEIPFAEGVHA